MIKLPIINRIFPSYKSKIIAVIVTGVIVGGGVLFMYMLRAHTYLGDDPAACVKCHIMSPYYATWFHSSHARDANCMGHRTKRILRIERKEYQTY